MENEIVYRCKASSQPPLAMVGIMTGLGLTVLFLLIFIHPVVAGVGMVAVMFVAAKAMTGAAEFKIDASGMQRFIVPSWSFRATSPKPEIQSWDHLKWFKEGKDRGRYTPEYRYLQVHFKNGSEWMITDNNGVRLADFEAFLGAFKKFVEEHNSKVKEKLGNSPLEEPSTVKLKQQQATIEQKKTIYETVWGKIFTILLGAIIVFFLYLKFTTSYVNSIATFKLFVILIPGFIYMWYRVFGAKK